MKHYTIIPTGNDEYIAYPTPKGQYTIEEVRILFNLIKQNDYNNTSLEPKTISIERRLELGCQYRYLTHSLELLEKHNFKIIKQRLEKVKKELFFN